MFICSSHQEQYNSIDFLCVLHGTDTKKEDQMIPSNSHDIIAYINSLLLGPSILNPRNDE